ncbi:MAG: bifunctional response regulator/alkaline phosphatase family protein [candidate division Zixibacteria bacterium]|nr:bifunctional response regulator/alkaline phosphatase family protein [candidate division Zixibacteria bacterium]
MKKNIKKILWVDDEIDQLQAHILFLKEKGYEIIPAANGDDAVVLVGNQDFHLVLLDEMMPGKDGLTTLEEIKEIKPSLPVVMVTKSEEEHLMEEAIGKKIDDYLTKPVNPSQILSVIKKILDTKKIRGDHLTQQYIKDFSQISMMLSGPMNWKDWQDLALKLAKRETEIENYPDLGLKQTLQGQNQECNSEFGRYIERNYPTWMKSDDRPTLSVDIVRKYLTPLLIEGPQPVVFIVIDCMRLDQWLVIEELLSEYFNISTDLYYSILPTATPYSRNAIFSGLFPEEFIKLIPEGWKSGPDDDVSLNRNERQLFDKQLLGLNMKFKTESKYVKVIDQSEGENILKKLDNYLQTPVLSIVYNFIDNLAHGRSESEILQEIAPDEAAFRSLMKSWFIHSPLFTVLRELSNRKCNVIITTDHGSILGVKGTTAYGRKDTSTNLRYKYGDNLNCDTKHAVLLKDPSQYRLPYFTGHTTYIIARENYYFIYPTKFNEYQRYYQNSFQHGGISIEEMILPVATLKSRQL